VRAEYARELGAYATATSNYTQTDRVALGGSWAISPKLVLGLNHSLSRVDYQGNPSGLAFTARKDDNQSTGLSLGWEPVQRLNFSAELQSLKRSSNLAGLDYDAVVANVSAQYSF
jgi:hypothetical protein